MKFDDKDPRDLSKIDKLLIEVDNFCHDNNDIIFCCEEHQFYIWKDDYYNPILDIQLEKYLLFKDEMFHRMSVSVLKTFIHRIATLKQKTIDQMNSYDIMDMKNGIYEMDSGNFVGHDRKFCSTVRIPYDYDAEAKCPIWEGFLHSVLEGDEERINILQEFFGYCLGRDNGFHKALVLTGDGRNGKGTTFFILEKLVGAANCCALKLGEMNNKETVSNLVGKLVNIDADTDSSASGYESDFRRITAGDPMVARKLYKDAFVFTPYVKLVVGANELPRIADKTRGFYDRLIVIPYDVSFYGREDFNLKEKLMKEISGIFNWAIEGRRRLYEKGRFSITHNLEEHVQEIRMENNPCEAYSVENIEFRQGSFITKKETYHHYEAWCKENGHRPLSKIRFGKEFFRINKEITKKDWRSCMAHNAPSWPDLIIKDKHVVNVAEEIVKWEE